MLDLQSVRQQLEEYRRFQVEEAALRAGRLDRAEQALRDCDAAWEVFAGESDRLAPDRPMAGLLGPPAALAPAPRRPPCLTLAATDGSQIYPDRHVEPTCFLLNVGRVAFQYGTTEPPILASHPRVKYRTRDVDDLTPDDTSPAGEEVVSALRDELEFEELLALAAEVRRPGRPILAVSDGTLLRWMWRGLRNRALQDRLTRGFATTLRGFREGGIPLCSYLSFSVATDVVRLLGLYRQLHAGAPDARSLDGLIDTWLFDRILAPGQRSALFASRFVLPHLDPEEAQIDFFYFKTDTPASAPEVARVEIPRWISSSPERVDEIHGILVDECRKGRGYPVILTEAHEQAVVRGADRALFFELIDTLMARGGQPIRGSMKRASKQRPLV
jgi:hypothetical protein